MAYDWIRETDCVVCGAGTAGTTAALAAAEQGLRVLAVDQYGSCGGSGANGLVTPLMHTAIAGNPACSYLAKEINERMEALGAAEGSWFDPVMLPLVLEDMLTERGVDRLYHTFVTGVLAADGKITGVEASNKSGNGLIRARAFIDATGDADLCARAGLPLLHGNELDGKNQPVSLRYLVGGVDTDVFWRYLSGLRQPDAPVQKRPSQFESAVTRGSGKTWPLTPAFDQAVSDGLLTEDDATYWQFFTVPGRPGEIAFNCPEFFDIHDADDADSQTRVQIEGKRAILRQLQFYRARLPGFERCYLSNVANMVGVRESRRAVTEHVLTAEECLSHRKFSDAILQTNYSVDVHGRSLSLQAIRSDDRTEPFYELPLRALIVRGYDNLLVAGRCAGSEFIAQSSLRIIPSCRAMGEAAGIAAAMALQEDVPLRRVDGAAVRRVMRDRGAVFVPVAERSSEDRGR